MVRTLLLLVAGAALGAAGAYWLVPQGRQGLPSGAPEGRGPPPASRAPATSVLPSIRERLSLYELAAKSDVSALESLAREAADSPESDLRRFRLDVLLGRYAELDPRGAVRFGRALGMEAELLLPIYQTLAAVDLDAALAELRDSGPRLQAREIGLAILRTIGLEGRNIERVLAVLPDVEESAFRVAAIHALARTSPADGLRHALALGNAGDRGHAVEHVADTWAQRDPHAALAALVRIEDPQLRATYQSAVVRGWSHVDPGAVLAYIEGLDSTAQQQLMRGGGLQAIAHADPLQALAMAERLPAHVAPLVRHLAMQRLAQQDPLAALAHAESLPPGISRREARDVIATSFAEQHPERAVAWALGLQPTQPGLLGSVLAVIARSNLDLALDLALEQASPMRRMEAVTSIIFGNPFDGSIRTTDLADRLLQLQDDVVGRSAVTSLMATWAASDASGALEWLLANTAHLRPEAYAQMAQQLGQQDPAAAALYAGQIPAERRREWIAHAASGYASADPAGAMTWLAQFRGEPGHQDGVIAIAQNVAWEDPGFAAHLLDGIDSTSRSATAVATTIAFQWAGHDPLAAAAWARALDSGARPAALAEVARRWAERDGEAARSWVLTLPAGDERDHVLGTLVAALALHTVPDPRLLDAFASDPARQQAAVSAVLDIAARDPAAARSFAASSIADQKLRSEAERMIEEIRQSALSAGIGQ